MSSSMGSDSYTHISWSEQTFTSEPLYHGFLDSCHCGAEVTKVSREIAPHMGRLVYKCDNDMDGPGHCSKWWDSAVVDEIDSLKTKYLRIDHQLARVKTKNIPKLQDQIDAIDNIEQVVLRDELDDLKTSLNNLKTNVDSWSAGFQYLVDQYEGRTLKDFGLRAIENVKSNAFLLGVTVGFTVSVAANIYLYIN